MIARGDAAPAMRLDVTEELPHQLRRQIDHSQSIHVSMALHPSRTDDRLDRPAPWCHRQLDQGPVPNAPRTGVAFVGMNDESLIAVVEDDEPVRLMLGRLLRLANYQVHEYASGEAFLASLTAQLPHCAIVDVHMPGLSGFDVQSRIRARNLKVPVILATASDDAALDRCALASGACALLRKPFSSEEWLNAIGTATAQ
ncbi:response regulator [Variovorax humicola]|uniref:Response regulator n=1 Tax=Variovorax humicola TaxID=1769758 RepID=A0ABU8W9J5_9BURK